MATKSISQLDTQATANETDLFEVAIVDANSASGYASKKESAAAIADAIVGEYQYPLRITGTTAKTIAGAINELKNLVDLLPQFAIEVVQTLPVSDISETTIYLVPASDPEQGNYYEEYIYVNNAWELVGTTAVDLSGYYTSAQVDTLLAAKANTSSLATVATSGAYSDLSGKPTIDTALDTTSTNAVENRAVASEINSIKSDITVDGSASGDIATFVDGSDNPLKELKISIVPVQDLHGQSNPYPAGGGKNLAKPYSYTSGIISYDGQGNVTVNGTRESTAYEPPATTAVTNGYCFKVPAGTYIPSSEKPLPSGITINVVNKDKVTISNGESFTITQETELFVRVTVAAGTYNWTSGLMLEAGSTQTAYAPYANICPITGWTGATINVSGEDTSDPTTYNIDWQSTAGTVYGGTLDVLNGTLTVTHGNKKFSDMNWYASQTDQTKFYASFAPKYYGSKGNRFKCSMLKNDGVGSQARGYYGADNTFRYWDSSVTSEIYVKTDTNYASIEDFLAVFGNADFYYELATPVTYQLTPTEIRSLLGINNVWADCGAITELKYIRDLNLCINDIIARIEALEGASSSRSLSLSPTLTKSIVSDSDTAEGKTEEETEEETKEEAQNER